MPWLSMNSEMISKFSSSFVFTIFMQFSHFSDKKKKITPNQERTIKALQIIYNQYDSYNKPAWRRRSYRRRQEYKRNMGPEEGVGMALGIKQRDWGGREMEKEICGIRHTLSPSPSPSAQAHHPHS